MDEERRILEELTVLEDQHRDLDERLCSHAVDMLERQRMKKQKLFLKDQMAKLRSNLVPDILA